MSSLRLKTAAVFGSVTSKIVFIIFFPANLSVIFLMVPGCHSTVVCAVISAFGETKPPSETIEKAGVHYVL